MSHENVGRGPATDLLSISLSPNDILGHQVGPDSPEMRQMALDLDRELAKFISFLGHEIGLANVWIALSADHGVSSLPDTVKKLRIPAANVGGTKLEEQLNGAITAKFSSGHPAAYLKLDYPLVWLDQEAFGTAHVRERDAEIAVGEAMKQSGLRDYYTKSQLAVGEVPNTAMGRKYLNSYSPEGSWFVMGVPDILHRGTGQGHGSHIALQLRYPRATRLLRIAIPARNLSDECRTRRSGGHARIAARNQCSDSLCRSSPDRSPRALASHGLGRRSALSAHLLPGRQTLTSA